MEYDVTTRVMGHVVYLTQQVDTDGIRREWKYQDTDELLESNNPRPCVLCHKLATSDGHDPCIANLPGVNHACCGHGVERGYVKFSNDVCLRGEFDPTHKK